MYRMNLGGSSTISSNIQLFVARRQLRGRFCFLFFVFTGREVYFVAVLYMEAQLGWAAMISKAQKWRWALAPASNFPPRVVKDLKI